MDAAEKVEVREIGTMELLARAGGLRLHELRWIEVRFPGALKSRTVGHARLWPPESVALLIELKAKIRPFRPVEKTRRPPKKEKRS